jgi:hypothetical protein
VLGGVGQARPHMPQWLMSVPTVTQASPQHDCPAAQGGPPPQPTGPMVQTPPAHIVPGRQSAPQRPQLRGSEVTSTQVLLQQVWPDSHAGPAPQPGATQRPAMHVVPTAQTLPQAPQLRPSLCVLAQPVPQQVWPAAQPGKHAAAPHLPPMHT